jgi:hypothetical protein
MKSLLTVLLILVFVLVSQKKGNPQIDQKQIDIKYLKIDDAVNLFIKTNNLKFGLVSEKDVRFDTTIIGTWFRLHYYAYVDYTGEKQNLILKMKLWLSPKKDLRTDI